MSKDPPHATHTEAAVAQVVEASPSNRKVGGSSPAPPGDEICPSVLEQDIKLLIAPVEQVGSLHGCL